MYQPKLPKDLRCPLEFALEFFSGRWKSRILCLLYSENSVRYNDIKRRSTAYRILSLPIL